MDMCVLNRLAAGSPDVCTDVQTTTRWLELICDEVDHRPQVAHFISVQMEYRCDVSAWDDQHVTGCDRVVVGKRSSGSTDSGTGCTACPPAVHPCDLTERTLAYT
ncbi:uncharacterized protein METZ01_LOCUS265060, partial [marine metagenome]